MNQPDRHDPLTTLVFPNADDQSPTEPIEDIDEAIAMLWRFVSQEGIKLLHASQTAFARPLLLVSRVAGQYKFGPIDLDLEPDTKAKFSVEDLNDPLALPVVIGHWDGVEFHEVHDCLIKF